MIFLLTTLSLIAGGIYVLGYSPFDLWFMPLIAVFVLVACLHNQRHWQGAIIGFSFGIGLMGVGVSWIYNSINTYSSSSSDQAAILTALFCLAMALFYAVFGFVYCYLNHSRKNMFTIFNSPLLLRVVSFPAIWIILELCRSHLFNGFPWLLMGDSMIDTYLAVWAPIGGSFLVGFFAILSVVILFHCMRYIPSIYVLSYQYRLFLLILICIIPWAIGARFSEYLWTEVDGKPVTIAAIQGNIPQERKWDINYINEIADTYSRATFINSNNQLVIWSEAAVPYVYPAGNSYYSNLHHRLKLTNTTLIYGALREDKEQKIYNSIFIAGAAGERRKVYDKNVLVPFGEYIPLYNIVTKLVPFLDINLYDTSAGNNPSSFQVGDLIIAPSICFEITLGSYVSRIAKDSNVLLTISNDSWFGDSLAPHQNIQIARMRAIENQMYLIRVTNNGITAVVNPYGKVTARLKQFQPGALKTSVIPRKGWTPYQFAGDIPLASFCVLILFIGIVKRRRSIINI